MAEEFQLTPPPEPVQDFNEHNPWPMPGKHVPNPVVVHPGEPAEPKSRRWWERLVGR